MKCQFCDQPATLRLHIEGENIHTHVPRRSFDAYSCEAHFQDGTAAQPFSEEQVRIIDSWAAYQTRIEDIDEAGAVL